MLNIIIFGPPGSGKGTQALKLAEKFNLVHLSTGDIFRANIKDGTELGKIAKSYMDKGDLVPDEITIKMLEAEVNTHPAASGFIYDGFPRTIAQTTALDKLMAAKNTSIALTLALEVDEEELTRRILLRGKESGRSDDKNENIIRNRIKEYTVKTAPLKNFYLKQRKLRAVNGIGSVEEIYKILCDEMAQPDLVVFNDRLNYSALINKFPWIVTENQSAIISPDVDGILCGLLMSHYLNWKIVGFYDGKRMTIKSGVDYKKCVFLDMEIYRQGIKSCGQHLVLYNSNHLPANWNNYSLALNPNILRGHDASKFWSRKYPLGTIHFLLCALSTYKTIPIQKSAIAPLLYVDGTFKCLLNYPDNCISWLHFLNAKEPQSPLFPLYISFANQKLSHTMHEMEAIFVKFQEINNGKKRGGDKIKLGEIKDGEFPEKVQFKAENLVSFLAESTGWQFNRDKWTMNNFIVTDFTKKIEKITIKKYDTIMKKSPFSLAITGEGGKRMEYALEKFSRKRKRKLR